jgi:chondroitin AC lyase
MGNYGLSFVESEVIWAYTLAGTYYAVDQARKGVLRNFLLEGHAWVLWQDVYDLSACGRHIDEGQQASKGRLVRELLNRMAIADSDYQTEYDTALQIPGGVTGSKVFWRSDYAMHRMTNWYASVRMCSIRIEGGEDTNYENMLGLHQSDGVLLVHQSGDEYRDIAGLWNWRRPPGVTTDQGISNLRPTDAQMQGRTSFVGGLGDGAYGVCAQDYRRDSLYARQAWFMEEDAIMCLGAGIDGVSISNVCTSVEQSMLLGTVTGSVGAVSNGTTTFPAGSWVHQGNVGYSIEQPFTVHSDTVVGNWQNVMWDHGDRPVTGEVFSVWIDHGVSPAAQSYAYTIYPQTAAAKMAARIANDTSVVLSNTTALQAVENNGGVHAVFYEAGQVVSGAGQTITVSHPCVVSLRGNTLYVCDPTQALSSLTVTIDGNPVPVSLPSGGYAGQQMAVDLAP